MTISVSDKRWIRKMVREEFRTIIDEMISEEKTQTGGYDGATEVKDDDWADESRRRVGFMISHNRIDAKHTK